jgi:AAA+ superfamily predicted ATPase
MSNPFLEQARVYREKAEAFCGERRWAEAADAYENLAKAWIALAGVATTPGARAERMAEYEKALAKAAECRDKADRAYAVSGRKTGKNSARSSSSSSSSSFDDDDDDDDRGDGDGSGDEDSDGHDWPPDSLHAQLAGDQVGDMLIAQIEGFRRTSGVTWDDIGGQEKLVADLKSILAQSVMTRPDGSHPDGAGKILMVGPPGTGKTFLVSALANSISSAGTFFDVALSGIEGHYKGMTEKAIGLLYETARFYAPSLVFIDEVDCLCTSRENGGGGAALGSLLAEMDGIKTKGDGKTEPPFVLSVAATNAPWALDAALLSRFGGHIVLVGAADAAGRRQILEKQLRRYTLESGDLLDWLSADERTAGFSGRDLQNLVANAVQSMQQEMNPGISTWTSIEEIKGRVQKERPLTRADFEKALKIVKASITPEMMSNYRSWMKDKTFRPPKR